MLTVVAWKWSSLFGPEYVNRLRSMLARNLRLPHELVCVTDDPRGIDPEVRIVAMPLEHAHTPRCRRRLWHFASERAADLGERILAIDLDVVILSDITPLIDRPDPVVCWRVGYANVYTGSFVLFNAGALDGLWRAYRDDPDRFPAATGELYASETAMLTYWIRRERFPVAEWRERDGLCMWFGGPRHRKLQVLGCGPDRPMPPRWARLVMFGSDDKAVLDKGLHPFVRDHWT